MPTYRVTWEIDIEAETPLNAAIEAEGHMGLRGRSAFTVCDQVAGDSWRVHLDEPRNSPELVSELSGVATAKDAVRVCQLEAAMMPFVLFAGLLDDRDELEIVDAKKGTLLLVKSFKDLRRAFLNEPAELPTEVATHEEVAP